jgi:hypothetical protein
MKGSYVSETSRQKRLMQDVYRSIVNGGFQGHVIINGESGTERAVPVHPPDEQP